MDNVTSSRWRGRSHRASLGAGVGAQPSRPGRPRPAGGAACGPSDCACSSPSAADSAGPDGARHPDDVAGPGRRRCAGRSSRGPRPVPDRAPRHPPAAPARPSTASSIVGVAGQRSPPGTRAAGARTALVDLAARRSRPGPTGPAPAAPGAPGSPTTTTRPPSAHRAHQRGGVAPSAHRLLVGAQVGAGQQQPGVEQRHRGVAAVGDRLGARCRDHDGRRPRRPRRAPGRPTTTYAQARPGTPAPAPRPSAVAEHRRAQPVAPALGARPAVASVPHQAQDGAPRRRP